MPILLNTPLTAGTMSADVYDHVKISRQVHDSDYYWISLGLKYGTITDGKFVAGGLDPSSAEYPKSVEISNDDYAAIINDSEPLPGERTYGAVKRGLYEYLQAKLPGLAGVIV